MREHPKLFKADMVNAILDGSKTQTRLPATFHNSITGVGLQRKYWNRLQFRKAWVDGEYLHVPVKDYGDGYHSDDIVYRVYPRYQVGDRLWVRETWRASIRGTEDEPGYVEGIEYRADGTFISNAVIEKKYCKKYSKDSFYWCPSMHMFREYSRINLEVTRRWPERVQDMSIDDALAEGVKAGGAFRVLWDSIYGKGTWGQNGYVWAYEFKVI